MLLQITSATWIVTGLGFGIVLVLLFCLVFILMGFGWIMQKATAPKAPKEEKPGASSQSNGKSGLRLEGENTSTPKQNPAPASPADDTAAIAYTLYLASCNAKHDAPTGMIAVQARETAWNTKSIGLNNVGF